MHGLHDSEAAQKTQTQMHGTAEKAHKDQAARRGRKQGKVQKPPQADVRVICGVR